MIFDQAMKDTLQRYYQQREAQLHDLILAALCGPMGRVRREYLVDKDTDNILGLSEVYP